MNGKNDHNKMDGTENLGAALTGGVKLSAERLALLAHQWEATHSNLRRMDSLDLGDREPATLFVWKGDQE